jgi:hypothetical protein
VNFQDNLSSESRVVPCGQTDRLDAAILRFRNFARAPKNFRYLLAFLGVMILAKQFLVTDNRCAVSQLFVGFAVKHFARTDGINKL